MRKTVTCPRCGTDFPAEYVLPQCRGCEAQWLLMRDLENEVDLVEREKRQYVDEKFESDLRHLVVISKVSSLDQLRTEINALVERMKDTKENSRLAPGEWEGRVDAYEDVSRHIGDLIRSINEESS